MQVNLVWQWTVKMYVKVENMHLGLKCCSNICFSFDDFAGPRPDCMTFLALKICILNYVTFHFQDLYAMHVEC